MGGRAKMGPKQETRGNLWQGSSGESRTGSKGVECGITNSPVCRRASRLKVGTLSRVEGWGAHPFLSLDDPGKAVEAVSSCASWLVLREYFETGKITISGANYCDRRGLCLACDGWRALGLIRKYGPVVRDLLKSGEHCYMITLTVPSAPSWMDRAGTGPEREAFGGARAFSRSVWGAFARECQSLLGQQSLLWSSFGKLWGRQKRNGTGPLRCVLGALLAMETTWHPSNGWHAHIHGVLVLQRGRRVDVSELRSEWQRMTRGTQIRLSWLSKEADLVEVLKYSTKPAKADDPEAAYPYPLVSHVATRGLRLVRSYGVLHGLVGDHEPTASEVVQEAAEAGSGPFREWLCRWVKGRYWLDCEVGVPEDLAEAIGCKR